MGEIIGYKELSAEGQKMVFEDPSTVLESIGADINERKKYQLPVKRPHFTGNIFSGRCVIKQLTKSQNQQFGKLAL